MWPILGRACAAKSRCLVLRFGCASYCYCHLCVTLFFFFFFLSLLFVIILRAWTIRKRRLRRQVAARVGKAASRTFGDDNMAHTLYPSPFTLHPLPYTLYPYTPIPHIPRTLYPIPYAEGPSRERRTATQTTNRYHDSSNSINDNNYR